jgi:hypothetical protein
MLTSSSTTRMVCVSEDDGCDSIMVRLAMKHDNDRATWAPHMAPLAYRGDEAVDAFWHYSVRRATMGSRREARTAG